MRHHQSHRPSDDHNTQCGLFDIETIVDDEPADGSFPPWPRHWLLAAAILRADWSSTGYHFDLQTLICMPNEETAFFQRGRPAAASGRDERDLQRQRLRSAGIAPAGHGSGTVRSAKAIGPCSGCARPYQDHSHDKDLFRVTLAVDAVRVPPSGGGDLPGLSHLAVIAVLIAQRDREGAWRFAIRRHAISAGEREDLLLACTNSRPFIREETIAPRFPPSPGGKLVITTMILPPTFKCSGSRRHVPKLSRRAGQ